MRPRRPVGTPRESPEARLRNSPFDAPLRLKEVALRRRSSDASQKPICSKDATSFCSQQSASAAGSGRRFVPRLGQPCVHRLRVQRFHALQLLCLRAEPARTCIGIASAFLQGEASRPGRPTFPEALMRARSVANSTLQSIAILAVLTATAHAQARGRPLESGTAFAVTPYV